MDWLFESPVTIVLLGIAALGTLGYLWAQTGKNAVLATLGVVAALLVAALIVERVVVTDREKLEATVKQIAADVRSNDRTRLYPHLYSEELRARAQAELPNYKFTECTVTKIYRLEVFPDRNPKEGAVEFMVRVAGSFSYQGYDAGDGTYLRYVTLYFIQDKDGQWKIRDYAHDDPSAALINRPMGK